MPFVDDLTKRKAGIDSPAKAPRASAPGGETEAPARKGSGVSGPDTPQPRVGGGGASGVGPEIPSTDSTRAPSDR